MRIGDLLGFTTLSLQRQRFRSLMMMLSVAMGVASVVILVSLGEAARTYVLDEFSFLGKDVLAIFPGRKTTTGGMPPITGASAQDLTLAQAAILERSVPGIREVAALIPGTAAVQHGGRERDTFVLGVSAAFFDIRQLTVGTGHIWDASPLDLAQPVAIIGNTIKRELFDNRRAIGEWIRIRDSRFRIIGEMDDTGVAFGLDVADSVFIPVASAQQLFNVNGVFRLILRVDPSRDRSKLIGNIENRMRELHAGELDVTVVNPDSMLASFSGILRAMTLAVAGIAAISLVVAGFLVMNLTLMSVQQRTPEIGLMKALGASAAQVRTIFVIEAAALAFMGSCAGIGIGAAAVYAGQRAFPDFPFSLPLWAVAGAATLAMLTALIFAWRPASQAASLSPIVALGRA